MSKQLTYVISLFLPTARVEIRTWIMGTHHQALPLHLLLMAFQLMYGQAAAKCDWSLRFVQELSTYVSSYAFRLDPADVNGVVLHTTGNAKLQSHITLLLFFYHICMQVTYT